MKLGIIGVGAVGAATAMAVVLRARVRELVLRSTRTGRAPGRSRPTCIMACRSLRWSRSRTAIMTTSKAQALSSSPPGSTRRRVALSTGAIRLAGFVFSTPM
jgi:hypothetical protein